MLGNSHRTLDLDKPSGASTAEAAGTGSEAPKDAVCLADHVLFPKEAEIGTHSLEHRF